MGTFTLAYITFALTRGGIYMGTFNVKFFLLQNSLVNKLLEYKIKMLACSDLFGFIFSGSYT